MTPRPAPLLVSFILALAALPLGGQTQETRPASVRILQTSAAGDDVQLIDPATNRVVDVIRGISIPHGATSHPDGSAFYISNEAERTLDVVAVKTLQVAERIPLTGRPNNVAITPDGAKVYVAIRSGTSVDVIDTRSNRLVKSIPTLGGVHNVYVTTDGRWAVAGMIDARTMTVIDTEAHGRGDG